MVNNRDGLVDEYGNRSPWIEIANTSWGTVNLQNCYLTNNRKALEDIPVPERIKLMSLISRGDSRTKLAAQERIVFFADGHTNLGTLHTNFALAQDKENFIALFDGNARTLLDSITIPADLPANCSYARILAKDMKSYTWKIMSPSNVTPGSSNDIGSVNENKVAEFKERDPFGVGMSILGMGIVFSCLIALYLFFRVFGILFRGKDTTTAAIETTADTLKNKVVTTDTVTAISDIKQKETYMAVIALALSNALNNHDDESGVITIKQHCSNWNPHTNYLD